MMQVDIRQLRQTIISTGVVGAIFGLVPVLAVLVFESEYSRHASSTRPLLAQAFDLSLVLLGSVAFCVVFFGLVPMAIQHAFVWLVRRWTGRP